MEADRSERYLLARAGKANAPLRPSTSEIAVIYKYKCICIYMLVCLCYLIKMLISDSY